MLWNKKEDKSALPDLPPLETPFKQELSQIPKMDEAEESQDMGETHALPSFPDSANLKGFSQTVIKEAVSDEGKEKKLESVGDTPKNFKVVEMEDSAAENQISIIGTNKSDSEQSAYQASALMTESVIPAPPAQASPVQKQAPQLFPSQPVQPAQQVNPVYQVPATKVIRESFAPLPQHFSRPPTPEKHSHIFIKIDRFFSAKKALDETKTHLNQIEDLLNKIREVKLKEEQELMTWEKELLTAKARIAEVTQNIFERVE